MKKYLAFLLAVLLVFSILPAPASAAPAVTVAGTAEPKPEVFSDILKEVEPPRCKSAVLMDAKSGDVLYAYLAPGAEEHSYPASITKVMTALLTLEAVERGELGLEQMITASETFGYDLEAGGTTQNIKPGEEMSVLDLLYCMLLPSANEAANILAEAVSGSVPAFVSAMNARAAELGMDNTHFANAHGLHNADHYTTAYDLALLVRQALRNDTFKTIVSSRSHVVPATNLYKERKITSTNALINPLYNSAYIYPKAIGVKTGSTSAAGKCLASAATKGKETLVCVVLGSEEVTNEDKSVSRYQFSESKRLLQWGFDSFSRKALIQTTDPVLELPVDLSADVTAVAVKPGEDLEAVLPNDLDPKDFQHDVTIFAERLEAPVEAGQPVGELTVRNGDTVYGTVTLVAAAPAKRSSFLGRIQGVKNFFAKTWVKVALVALVVLVIVLIFRSGGAGRRKGSQYRGKKYGGRPRKRR